MRKNLKMAVSLLLCALMLAANAPILSAADEVVTISPVEDAFASNFSGQGNTVMAGTTPNKLIYGKFRHAYLRFDLSDYDTSNIDDIVTTLYIRKTHGPNTLIFTECEPYLRTDGLIKWTTSNLTYNSRPMDIDGSPEVQVSATTNGEQDLYVDLTAIFKNALSQGRKEVNIHLTTAAVDVDATAASECYSTRYSNAAYHPYLQVKGISGAGDPDDPPDEPEIPVELAGKAMGSYADSGNVASMIFKMRGEDGKYVMADPSTESLRLTENAAEASMFALYVLDYYANVDYPESEQKETFGATLTAYSIKCLDNDKYLTIQNYFTEEEFLSNTHQYFNILSGAAHGTSNSRVYEVKAGAEIPNWNERFYIDYYPNSDYYRVWSHLATMRDDSGFARFNVKITDTSMQSTGITDSNTEYRFYFEEVTGRDLLEVCQEVSGDTAVLYWNPVNGDKNPANYQIEGAAVVYNSDSGFMTAEITGLAAGTHEYTVRYGGNGYQAEADVTVRIFSHPGILQTQEELASMRDHVRNKEEPWYSDYRRMLDSVPYNMSSCDYVTTARVGVGRGTPAGHGNIGDFEKGGNAAYFNALLWVITGDARHADKAVDILNQWAYTLKVIDGRDRILGAGLNGYKYACAAEIMRYFDGGYPGYEDADFKALQDMMKNVVYPAIQDAGVPLLANGNWDDGAFVTMISIGVLCDDTELFDRATALYQDIHVNGSIFAYVHESGQTMETGRDQAHAQLAIGCMAETCQIANNQGVDLYSLYDNRLAKAFEYTAKYNLYAAEMYEGEEQVPFVAMPNVFHDTGRGYYGTRFDNDSNGLNRGELRPVYEQALALYSRADGVDMTWTARAAEAARPQALVHLDNLNFSTLTAYNGEPLGPSEPYFQLRTRWEPLYQRTWVTADGERVAETANSYYDVDENGELVTSVMKKDAPFFQLVSNDDGTYSIRLLKTNTYLSVKDETEGNYNVIKADATTIGDNEKFILQSNCVGNYFLVSPKYDNRIVCQQNTGTGSTLATAVLTLRLGTRTLSDVYNTVDNGSQNERLFFMYNIKDIALNGIEPGPEITSVSVTTPTIVATLEAYLNIKVEGERLEGETLTAHLDVDGDLLYPTPIVNGAGRMHITKAPAAETYKLVVVSEPGKARGECEITVKPYNTDIWEANAYVLDGKLLIAFNEDMTLKTAANCVTVGGKAYGAMIRSDNRTVEVLGYDAGGLPFGTEVVVKGVKYPVLFPSYSFTYTVLTK